MKNRLLLPALTLLFILSSCSNMRFGHVPKLKPKKQTAVAQRTPEKKNITVSEVIESKKQPATKVVANYEVPNNADFSPAAPLTSTDKTTAPKTTVTKPAKKDKTHSLQELLSPKQIKKLKKSEKMAATKEANHNWLWYIVVGIVLILIGAVLAAIELGLIGAIFWLVGVIAIIYGLLIFIDVV
jgi:hypothetical protein